MKMIQADNRVTLEPETDEDLRVLIWMAQQRELSFVWMNDEKTKGSLEPWTF